MWPVLNFGFAIVHSFGFFLAVGVLVASFFVWKQSSDRGLAEERVIDAFLLALFGLVVGGRVGYIFFHWPFFGEDWGRMFLFLKYPGFSFLVGLATAAVLAAFSSLVSGLGFWEMMDIFSIGFLSGAVFGNFGCFLNGCLAGQRLTPLFMALLSLFLLFIFSFILRLLHRSVDLSRFQRRAGIFFLCYLIFYPLSFLILTKPKQVNESIFLSGVAAIALVFFLIRYRELLAMGKVMFPSNVLTQIRSYLEERRKDTEKRLAQLKREDPFEDKTRLLDRASDDSEAQSKAGHERVAALQRQLTIALIETKKALTKIKLGKYGVCEVCGKMIDTDRLAALPTATLCLEHEKRRER